MVRNEEGEGEREEKNEKSREEWRMMYRFCAGTGLQFAGVNEFMREEEWGWPWKINAEYDRFLIPPSPAKFGNFEFMFQHLMVV
ncbi:hypothetical protein SAY86_003504 [Trapa natans]|uniref:Uncharacterized protein n=1 Tax=Trapa natans TaxID=22666 RepID=A0AAN7RGZ9_TRANT|nr:hypothetical protein SAY86_003504 [Trapa natans]